MCAYQLWLLQRLFVGRNDKSVRQTGLGFLVYLLLGALSGQGMLMAHSWELYRIGINAPELEDRTKVHTWAQCHAQSFFLLIHIELHAAPLSAKVWRVWAKVRAAETQKLQLWDRTAQRIALIQILTFLLTIFAHIVVAAPGYDDAMRENCVEDGDPIEDRERYFYFIEAVIMGCALLPAWPLIAMVSGSSFTGIFPSWPSVTISVYVSSLALCLYGESFFVGTFYVVALGARQLGVQVLSLIMLWSWEVPALSSRLGFLPFRRRDRSGLDALLHDDTSISASEQTMLERQAELQVHTHMHMHTHPLTTLPQPFASLSLPHPLLSHTLSPHPLTTPSLALPLHRSTWPA